MKKIEINTARYPEDCERIQKILKERGYEASIADCEALWDRFSDSMAAGWFRMDHLDDNEVFDEIRTYITN